MQSRSGCFGLPKAQDPAKSLLIVDGWSGNGSTYTVVGRFANTRVSTGMDIGYSQNSVFGDLFLIRTDGTYCFNFVYNDNAGTVFGLYLNPGATEGVTNPQSGGTDLTRLLVISNIAINGQSLSCSYSGPLKAGDVVQALANSVSPSADPAYVRLAASRLG